MSTFKIREISEIALLAAFIAVSGAFKLPSFIPGSEFQLSAPIAVAICGVFGIKKYLLAGILASAGGLLLGTQTIFNVLIAMLFRIVVALLYAVLGKTKIFYLLSGPVASSAGSLPSVGSSSSWNDFHSINIRVICFCFRENIKPDKTCLRTFLTATFSMPEVKTSGIFYPALTILAQTFL